MHCLNRCPAQRRAGRLGAHSLGHVAIYEGLHATRPQRRPNRVCAIYLRPQTLSESSAGPGAAVRGLRNHSDKVYTAA